jgi:hypothetical protein
MEKGIACESGKWRVESGVENKSREWKVGSGEWRVERNMQRAGLHRPSMFHAKPVGFLDEIDRAAILEWDDLAAV